MNTNSCEVVRSYTSQSNHFTITTGTVRCVHFRTSNERFKERQCTLMEYKLPKITILCNKNEKSIILCYDSMRANIMVLFYSPNRDSINIGQSTIIEYKPLQSCTFRYILEKPLHNHYRYDSLRLLQDFKLMLEKNNNPQ